MQNGFMSFLGRQPSLYSSYVPPLADTAFCRPPNAKLVLAISLRTLLCAHGLSGHVRMSLVERGGNPLDICSRPRWGSFLFFADENLFYPRARLVLCHTKCGLLFSEIVSLSSGDRFSP